LLVFKRSVYAPLFIVSTVAPPLGNTFTLLFPYF
jgi:hypothetical protein